MGFEFEYERPDRRSDSSSGRPRPPRPPRRRRRFDQRRQAPRFWRRIPRWGKATAAVVLILAASTIITSRDRSSDQSALEVTSTAEPPASAPTATAIRPATTRPVATRPATTRPVPPVTTTPPVTTSPPATTVPPATAAASTAAAQTPPTAVPVAPAPTAPPPEGVDWAELALSVVYVQADDCPALPSDLVNSGSGTVVLGGGYVLTNAHVVTDDNGQPCREIGVWLTRSFEEEPTDWRTADLTARDSRLDLALLELRSPAPSARSVEVSAQRLDPGEDIRILGYPGVGGLTMTLTRGSYSGMIDEGGETYIKTDADISEGNSGGAAFDEAGVFIGVPTAGIGEVGLLIPAELAEQFLNRALNQ